VSNENRRRRGMKLSAEEKARNEIKRCWRRQATKNRAFKEGVK
jgi:hypothetical protein